LGSSVTNISQHAFASCENLEKVVIGNSVANIGKCAFYGCDNLKRVVIPKGSKEKFKNMLCSRFAAKLFEE